MQRCGGGGLSGGFEGEFRCGWVSTSLPTRPTRYCNPGLLVDIISSIICNDSVSSYHCVVQVCQKIKSIFDQIILIRECKQTNFETFTIFIFSNFSFFRFFRAGKDCPKYIYFQSLYLVLLKIRPKTSEKIIKFYFFL